MTRQITIKLNERRFRPLLNDFNSLLKGSSQSDSWLIGFLVWYVHRFCFHKKTGLEYKSVMIHLMDQKKLNIEEATFVLLGKYRKFLRDEKNNLQSY